MEYLLPRTEKLEKITFATRESNYRRDEERKNIYDSIQLSQLLEMQYTKVS